MIKTTIECNRCKNIIRDVTNSDYFLEIISNKFLIKHKTDFLHLCKSCRKDFYKFIKEGK